MNLNSLRDKSQLFVTFRQFSWLYGRDFRVFVDFPRVWNFSHNICIDISSLCASFYERSNSVWLQIFGHKYRTYVVVPLYEMNWCDLAVGMDEWMNDRIVYTDYFEFVCANVREFLISIWMWMICHTLRIKMAVHPCAFACMLPNPSHWMLHHKNHIYALNDTCLRDIHSFWVEFCIFHTLFDACVVGTYASLSFFCRENTRPGKFHSNTNRKFVDLMYSTMQQWHCWLDFFSKQMVDLVVF